MENLSGCSRDEAEIINCYVINTINDNDCLRYIRFMRKVFSNIKLHCVGGSGIRSSNEQTKVCFM